MPDATRGVLRLQESCQRSGDIRDIRLTIEMACADAMPHEDEGDVRVVGRPYAVRRTLRQRST